MLEAANQPINDETVWSKVAEVQSKLEANQAAQKENAKWAKKVIKAIEGRLG